MRLRSVPGVRGIGEPDVRVERRRGAGGVRREVRDVLLALPVEGAPVRLDRPMMASCSASGVRSQRSTNIRMSRTTM